MGSISISSQVSILFVSAFAEFLLKLVERLLYERLCIVLQIVICPFDHPIRTIDGCCSRSYTPLLRQTSEAFSVYLPCAKREVKISRKYRSHPGPVPQVSRRLCEAKPEAKNPIYISVGEMYQYDKVQVQVLAYKGAFVRLRLRLPKSN